MIQAWIPKEAADGLKAGTRNQEETEETATAQEESTPEDKAQPDEQAVEEVKAQMGAVKQG